MRPTFDAQAQGANCARALGWPTNEDGHGGASRLRRGRSWAARAAARLLQTFGGG